MSSNEVVSVNPPLDELTLTPENLQSIINLLRKNGLIQTEESLTKEAGHLLKNIGGGDDGQDEEIYLDKVSSEFEGLLDHIQKTPDYLKGDIATLIYPMFVYLFIDMIMDDKANISVTFFEKYKANVPEWYQEQIFTLSRIKSKIQAQNCELVKILCNSKFTVRVSKQCLKNIENLMNLFPMLQKIEKERLKIESYDQGQKHISTLECELGGLLGQSATGEKGDKKYKVLYGTLKEDITDSFASDKKRQKMKEGKENKKKDNIIPAIDRIPLPTLTENMKSDRRAAQKEYQKRCKLGKDQPPTICMYTFLNGRKGVCSVDITEDSQIVGAGLFDSRVYVTSIGDNELKLIKPISELEELDQDDLIKDDDLYDNNHTQKNFYMYGHSAPVYSVNFSPDKKLLLSSSHDNTVRLWCLGIKKNLVVYHTTTPVYQAQFCQRGGYFATACAGNTAMIWSTDRLQPLRIFAEPLSDVTCIDYHPNCSYLIGGSDDRYVRVWDILTGSCVKTFAGHKGSITGVKVSPDGRFIASTSSDGTLIIWDLATSKMIAHQSIESSNSMGAIAFSRDSEVVAVNSPYHGISFYGMEALRHSLLNPSNDTTLVDQRVNPKGFHLYSYATKNTPMLGIHFTRRNLVVGLGAFNQ
ncbi:TAF5-like RNA polymerase II p300/CBP-associated factor-associated factor 65 kDa subunit 5L [Strongyloides ratti]|uniref:TAF5-like RNA polymerase II p300/CBP-associated factor-associated factor 65 kDa subunit 5L n=1 Tax=Strongyloides ratti TaxID=34506 RepID=A0A090L7N9_STRRB|nr:TAF5-like RNA polymerase II p300/CBP-associated factor-associated factor 65 kDa subunit 5L [Strongyloides ratti]CEF65732.1 TAF5-like RNA polymerase II p300/CBP-associated factor-associated factor 65 kDa subunit 5L [Strongyloides ratti]